MIAFFRNFQLDRNSFWLGFIAGALFFWILSRLRVYLPAITKSVRDTFRAARESASTSIENRLRLDVLRIVQRQHLAANFFSLDEIAIEPRLMAPPPQMASGHETLPIDATYLTIPYMPDWPEMAATYHTTTISLTEAAQGGTKLILLGHAGSGKTVALSLLASQLARRDPSLGSLSNLIPLYVHAGNITYHSQSTSSGEQIYPVVSEDQQLTEQPDSKTTKTKPALDALIDAIAHYASPLTLPRLPSFIRMAVAGDRAIILMDGMDELHPQGVRAITSFVKDLLQQHPNIKMVVAASFDDLAGLPSLDFHPIAMASWSKEDQATYIDRWSRMWERHITGKQPDSIPQVDQYFLNSWLSSQPALNTPLEIALKVWSAFSGDILGADGPSAIDAYLRRLIPDVPNSLSGMERFALQMINEMKPVFSSQEASHWISDLPSDEPLISDSPSSIEDSHLPTYSQPRVRAHSLISSMEDCGLLVPRSESRLSFQHIFFAGYLAGCGLAQSSPATMLNQPIWSGKTLAFLYLARCGDVSQLVQYYLQKDDFLHRDHLQLARWLTIAPRHKPWRSLVLRTLVSVLNKEKDTLGLSAKIITAIALSGDPGVIVLFQQLLKSEHYGFRQLAALGCGLIGDPKVVEDLSQLLQDKTPAIVRAACLALVALGDKPSLEIVASALLSGSELMRRSAAEALANNPQEGHPALEEGSTMPDLMVRRSVVYGLMRIHQPWANQILERLQLEDKEWVVRNAAIQALEEIKRPSPYIPRPHPDLVDTPWLVEFTGKLGQGLAPGKPAFEMLLQALKNGTEDERIGALEYLRLKADESAIPLIYNSYYGSSGDVREAAYHALWIMAIAGVNLPSPHQYGLG